MSKLPDPYMPELHEGEPCFVIRGRDPLALPAIQAYIDLANAMNHPIPVLRDLIQLSADVRYWQDKNRDKTRLLD